MSDVDIVVKKKEGQEVVRTVYWENGKTVEEGKRQLLSDYQIQGRFLKKGKYDMSPKDALELGHEYGFVIQENVSVAPVTSTTAITHYNEWAAAGLLAVKTKPWTEAFTFDLAQRDARPLIHLAPVLYTSEKGDRRMKTYENGEALLTHIWWKVFNTGPLTKARRNAVMLRLDAEVNIQSRRPDVQFHGFQKNVTKANSGRYMAGVMEYKVDLNETNRKTGVSQVITTAVNAAAEKCRAGQNQGFVFPGLVFTGSQLILVIVRCPAPEVAQPSAKQSLVENVLTPDGKFDTQSRGWTLLCYFMYLALDVALRAAALPPDFPPNTPAEFQSSLSGERVTVRLVRKISASVYLVSHDQYGTVVMKMDMSPEVREAMQAREWSTCAFTQVETELKSVERVQTPNLLTPVLDQGILQVSLDSPRQAILMPLLASLPKQLLHGDVEDLLVCMRQSLRTLEDAGLVHLDVRPDNIMRRILPDQETTEYRLIDLGMSQQWGSTRPHDAPGNVLFSSLGPLQGSDIEPWTDHEALANTLLYLQGTPLPWSNCTVYEAIQARLDFMQDFVEDARNKHSGPVNLYVVAVYSLILANKEVEHSGLSAQLDTLIQSLVETRTITSA